MEKIDVGLTAEELVEGCRLLAKIANSEEVRFATGAMLILHGSEEMILRELSHRYPENKEYQDRLDNYNKPISKIKRFFKNRFDL